MRELLVSVIWVHESNLGFRWCPEHLDDFDELIHSYSKEKESVNSLKEVVGIASLAKLARFESGRGGEGI